MELQGRSIVAYFADRGDAEEAAERLRHAGLPNTELDPVVPSGDAVALADGHLGAPSGFVIRSGASPAPLLADGPLAESQGAVQQPGAAWMVVTLTDGSDVQVERAVKILKQYGGEV